MPAKVSKHLKARILTKRADFLRAKGSGLRVSTVGFALQILPNTPEDATENIALGFTCAKRSFGTGVAVNRAKRRLKEAWAQVAHTAPKGCAYVVVGRVTPTEISFSQLVSDMQAALVRAGGLLTQTPKTGKSADI